MTKTAAYGEWPSPLPASVVAAGSLRRSALKSDGVFCYWVENRPGDGADVVVRTRRGEQPSQVSATGASVRSRVHEYGGGAYALVRRDGATCLVEVHLDDQRVHLVDTATGRCRPLGCEAPEGEEWRHGDLSVTGDGEWVLAVRERHRDEQVTHELVAVSIGAPGREATLAWGRDFFAAPRSSPDATLVSWLCWDHPHMSWDESELWVAHLESGPTGLQVIEGAERVAGGPGVSVGQPMWCDDGSLVYAADDYGWWQPWRWQRGEPARRLSEEHAEFHGPDWGLGTATMAELADRSLLVVWRSEGRDRIGVVGRDGGPLTEIDQPCVEIDSVTAQHGTALWLGATASAGPSLWWSPEAAPGAPYAGRVTPLLADADIAVAEPFSFVSEHDRVVHGLFYAPTLGGTAGPAGEWPPLVVACHGGPTAGARPGFNPLVQFFTTRGFAVVDVDYAGSSGYGRAYRRSLAGGWGVVDVADCIDTAAFLADAGLGGPGAPRRVDGRRMAIRGGSAGGFAALSAMVQSDRFAACASWYGVTDLLALVASTHDFEARYTDGLIGPLPEAHEEYERRSPINRVAEIHGAVLILQGLDDPVVPPTQATSMVDELRQRGIHCEYVAFEGESHGFRRAHTIEAALEAELDFYRRVFGRSSL